MRVASIAFLVGIAGCTFTHAVSAAQDKYKENVLYSFSGKDGCLPYAGLIDVNGILYGTTSKGGKAYCTDGAGTVFALDPKTGTQRVLHSFRGKGDGKYPYSNLIDLNDICTEQHGRATTRHLQLVCKTTRRNCSEFMAILGMPPF